jgi:hypothetical protein
MEVVFRSTVLSRSCDRTRGAVEWACSAGVWCRGGVIGLELLSGRCMCSGSLGLNGDVAFRRNVLLLWRCGRADAAVE